MPSKRKYGAYVPDDIVERAKSAHPDGGKNFSQLVEDALREYAEIREADTSPERRLATRMRNAPTGELAVKHAAKFADAVDALSAVGLERIDFGYELGLMLAAELSLEELGRCLRAKERLSKSLSDEIELSWQLDGQVQDADGEFFGVLTPSDLPLKLLELTSLRRLRTGLQERGDVSFDSVDEQPTTDIPVSILEGVKRALIDVGTEVTRRLSLDTESANEPEGD